jgi:hypothetical protein
MVELRLLSILFALLLYCGTFTPIAAKLESLRLGVFAPLKTLMAFITAITGSKI